MGSFTKDAEEPTFRGLQPYRFSTLSLYMLLQASLHTLIRHLHQALLYASRIIVGVLSKTGMKEFDDLIGTTLCIRLADCSLNDRQIDY